MLERMFGDYPWLVAVLWAGIYTSDFGLTMMSARLYRESAAMHFNFGGSLELTPVFQEDVDRLRRVSPRFLGFLLLSTLSILLVWFLSVRVLGLRPLFSILVGGLLLRELAVHMRHARNLVLFRATKIPDAINGKVSYSRRLVLKASAAEFLAFAGLYLLLWLLVGGWSLAGGALACAMTGYQHWAMMKKALPRVSTGAG